MYIVMYHYMRDLPHSRYPHIKGLDLPLFRQQLEFFKQNFNVVTMEQVIAAITPPQLPNELASNKLLSNEVLGNEGNELLPENAVLLTFDDGYVDNFTYALPLLEEFGFQGSFFIPGKTFTEHKLLDVNKLHYILASAENETNGINKLVSDLFERMDFYRGKEFDFPSNEELFQQWAVAGRFDSKEIIFIKRILQTVLPEKLRNRISSDLFEKYVGISEEKLAHELYMTEGQVRTLKKHGHFIGIHGYDHYWLGNLEPEQMKADVSKALDVMDEFIDRKQWVMNYSYGNWNDGVLDYIKSRGAVVGLTTEVRVAKIGVDENLKLPRLDCNDFPPKSENYKELAQKIVGESK